MTSPRTIRRDCVVSMLALAAVTAQAIPARAQSHANEYPVAHRVDHTDVYHGVEIEDPYRWMEQLESEELHAWLTAQDEVRGRFFEDTSAVAWFKRKIAERGRRSGRGIPVVRGEAVFRTQRDADPYGLTLYVKRDGSERALLDLAAMQQKGTAFVGSYSPDGRYVTLVESENQSAWQTVRVMDVESGAFLADTVSGIRSSGGNTPWSADGNGFYYVRYPVPDDPNASLGRAQIFYHLVGTSPDADELVYHRPGDPLLSYGLRVSNRGRYLIISASIGGSFTGLSERVFYRDLTDPNGQVIELFTGMDAEFAFEGNNGPRFVFRTNFEAPRMRIVEVDPGRADPDHWRELVPETESPIVSVSEIDDYLVVQYTRDARTVVTVYDFEGSPQYQMLDDIVAPSIYGSIWNDDRNSKVTYYGIGNLFDRTIYRLDVASGKSTIYHRPESSIDPDDFVMEQVFYTSNDGTRVPMFLARRKDLRLDGSNPVYLYGYGFAAWSAFPWQGYLVPWMQMGGIYAVANIRGGGEYGDEWHAAGKGRHKQTSIDDYLAAAEYLVREGYTTPNLLAANGGSASGMLPAAATIQRPDLFGAAIINYPVLDMLRYTQFGSAKSWVEDLGDPEDPDDFAVLASYSPYHNIEADRCYPATWIQVGDHDNVTTPMHGYKYAAALQVAQTCDNPVILKVTWGAGHTWGVTREQSQETQAEELAFLVKVFGLETPGEP